jgi:4-carboxymuconolactone decarboxylase
MADKPTAERTIRRHRARPATYTDEVLFGDAWERLGLSKRDRSLVTVTCVVSVY